MEITSGGGLPAGGLRFTGEQAANRSLRQLFRPCFYCLQQAKISFTSVADGLAPEPGLT